MTGLRSVKLALQMGIALLLVLAVAVGYADSAATTTTTKPSEKLITLQVTNTPVIDVIDLLFSQAGYNYTVESGVSGNITLKLKGVKFVDALKSLAEGADLTYKVNDGRYIISAKPKPKPVVVAGSTSPETDLPLGHPDIIPDDDLGPIFYGDPEPELPGPFDIIEYPFGATNVYLFPNGNSLIVVQSYGFRRYSILNSPALNSNDWDRFKREAAPFRFMPPKFR